MFDTLKNQYKDEKIELSNGSNIAYIDAGSGEKTLLFIHGLASFGLSWWKNIDYLQKHYRCIAIDLPGSGYSKLDDKPYSINYYSESVYEFIQQIGLKNLCIVGHSMGAQVAIDLVAKHPDCAEQLVLCAPAGFEQFNSFERTIYSSTISLLDFFSTEENSLRQTIRTSFYNYSTQIEGVVNELVKIMNSVSTKHYKAMIEASIRGMLNEPVFDKLKSIQQPTLVIFGEQDALIPNRMIHPTSTKSIAEAGLKELQNGTLVMIAQCGHFVQFERSGEVNGYIEKFVG